MKNLEIFFNLFPFEYLKEILIPKNNNLLKHPMDLIEFIQWLGCWLYMGFWVRNSNRSNWWLTADPTMSENAPFRLNKYISMTGFEGIL